jgi:hypothetical protein
MNFKESFKLLPHQKNIEKKTFLYWDTGTGKTYGSVNIAIEHGYKNIIFITLAVNIKNIIKQLNDVLEDVNIVKDSFDIDREKSNIFVMSFNALSKYGLNFVIDKLENCFVIFDEFHKYLNNDKSMIYNNLVGKKTTSFNSKTKKTETKGTNGVLERLKGNCLFSSATTIANTINCIAISCYLNGIFFKDHLGETVGRKKSGELSLYEFKSYFLKTQIVRYDKGNFTSFSNDFKTDFMKSIFYDNLYELSNRAFFNDVVGVDNNIIVNEKQIYIELDECIEKIQKSLKKDKVLEIADTQRVVNTQEKIMLLRAIAGCIYFDKKTYSINELINDFKISKESRVAKRISNDVLNKDKEMFDILYNIDFTTGKCLVTCYNVESANRVYDLIRTKTDFKVFRFLGDDSLMKENDICVATIDSVGVGLDNFKICNNLIIYQTESSITKRIQLLGRLTRIGSPHKEVFVYDLIYKKTFEIRLLELLNGRQLTIEMYNDFVRSI